MINIISNNCMGGRYYKVNKKIKFPNPFMYNLFKLNEFIKLVENFDEIDLNNIETCFVDDTTIHMVDPYAEWTTVKKEYWYSKVPRIKIDNLIDGYFIHHHYDDNEEPITIKSERKSKNILSIIRENWKKRLQRFNKENIVFIFSDDTRVTNDDLMKFVNVKTPYKKILLSNKDFSKYNCDNFLYVKMIPFVHDIDNMIAKKEVSEFIGEIL